MSTMCLAVALTSMTVSAPCFCISCGDADGTDEEQAATKFRETLSRKILAFDDLSYVDIRLRTRIALGVAQHVQVEALFRMNTLLQKIGVPPMQEYRSPVPGETLASMSYDRSVRRTVRRLALSEVHRMMGGIRMALGRIDRREVNVAIGEIEREVLVLERTLAQPSVDNVALLVRQAVRTLRVLHAIKLAQEQLRAVSVPGLSMRQNFVIAQHIAPTPSRKLRKLGSNIIKLHLRYGEGYQPGEQLQFCRALTKLRRKVKKSARAFKNVGAVDQALVELLQKFEGLQRQALARYPFGDNIERSIAQLKNIIAFLYVESDAKAVQRYVRSQGHKFALLTTQMRAISDIPPGLTPFMGNHDEEAFAGARLWWLVDHLRVVKVGGVADLLGEKGRLYRSRSPRYSEKRTDIMLRVRDVALLRESGILHILSLDDCPYNALARKRLEDGGIRLMEIPVQDFQSPTLHEVKKAVAFLEAANKGDESALIHCGFGSGRTGSVVASYEVYKVVEAWKRMHGTIVPYTTIMKYIRERSHFSRFDFLRHGIERVDQERVVQLYATSLLVGLRASDVPREATTRLFRVGRKPAAEAGGA